MTSGSVMVPDDLQAFAAEVESFYETHRPRRTAQRVEWGLGSDGVAPPIVAGRGTPDEERAEIAESRAWQAELFDAGLAWLTGPVDLGGRGLTAEHERIRNEIAQRFVTPDDTLVRTGSAVLGPSLLHYGQEAVRTVHLPRIHRGDELVCQLFSEPDAGSDLANIAALADRDGDDWIIDGQKVWSSGAHHADTGLCVARTNRTLARHAGLSTFLIDMRSPGVDVRPIRQMTSGSEFCEVFLDGVRVSDDRRVGDVDKGWAVVIDVLMNERSTIGRSLLPDEAVFERLRQLVVRFAPGDAIARDRLADVRTRLTTTSLFVDRVLAATPPGASPGPELALAKLAVTDVLGRMGALASHVLGPSAQADTGAWGTFSWSELVLGVPGMRIGGGTDEVLKNGIAERVLGLPREPSAAR